MDFFLLCYPPPPLCHFYPLRSSFSCQDIYIGKKNEQTRKRNKINQKIFLFSNEGCAKKHFPILFFYFLFHFFLEQFYPLFFFKYLKLCSRIFSSFCKYFVFLFLLNNTTKNCKKERDRNDSV